MAGFGQYPVVSSLIRGGRVVRWLVVEGARVHEDQDIAETFAPTLYSNQATKSVLRSPISGKIIKLAPPTPIDASNVRQALESGAGAAFAGSDTAIAFIEYCTHGVLFGTLCSVCAVDVNSLPPRTKELWHSAHADAGRVARKRRREDSGDHGQATTGSAPSSSTVAGAGGHAAANGKAAVSGLTSYRVAGHKAGYELTVSDAAAEDSDAAMRTRLRSQKKLVLVLDLDHTLVHATHDERAGAVQAERAAAGQDDVHTFEDGTWRYWIKLRPFVREFLERASTQFELHVDTAGTRAYARSVLTVLDPTGRLFGGRVVSRCDSALKHKEAVSWVHRSFRDASMTLIVDDTRAVWKGAPQLLQVEPYVFWLSGPDAEANNVAGRSVTDTGARLAPVPSALSLQASSASSSATAGIEGEVLPQGETQAAGFVREEPHAYLTDILRVLQEVHSRYYSAVDQEGSAAKRGSLGDEAEITTAELLEEVQRCVLSDVCMVMSGVFPLDMPPAEMWARPLWQRCLAFGGGIADSKIEQVTVPALSFSHQAVKARAAAIMAGEGPSAHAMQSIASEISLDARGPIVTHVVARTGGTLKTRAAAAAGDVRVVSLAWLEDCLRRYQKQPEENYPLQGFEKCTSVRQEARSWSWGEMKRLYLEEAAQSWAMAETVRATASASVEQCLPGHSAAEESKPDPLVRARHAEGEYGLECGEREEDDEGQLDSGTGSSQGEHFANELEGMFGEEEVDSE